MWTFAPTPAGRKGIRGEATQGGGMWIVGQPGKEPALAIGHAFPVIGIGRRDDGERSGKGAFHCGQGVEVWIVAKGSGTYRAG